MGAWALFDLALLSFGAVSVAMSIILQGATDPLTKLSFLPGHISAGLILGIMLLITFVISIGAIIQKAHIIIPLMALNCALVVDGLVVVIVGTMLWVPTLDEQNNFFARFSLLPDIDKIAIQDQLLCCGYFSHDQATIGGQICTSVGIAAQQPLCVVPLTTITDTNLNMAFTLVYAFMTAIIPLLLATLCVIKKREEDERFKRIDAKRGGHGFA